MKFVMILFFLMSSIVFADSYYVDESLSDVETLGSETLRHITNMALEEEGLEVKKYAGSATYEINAKALKLGQKTLLFLTQKKSGKVVFSQKIKMDGVDQADAHMRNLIRKMLGKSEMATRKVGKITSEEQGMLKKRREALNLRYAALGVGKFGNLNNDQAAYFFRYGYFWDTHEHFAIKMLGDISFSLSGVSTTYLAAGLGLNYYFVTSDFTPYVGADFGYATADSLSVDNASGVGLGLSAGFIVFRTSSAQLGLEARYHQLFKDNIFGKPRTLTLAIGLYY